MIEKGSVYFLKTGVKIPYFVLLVGRLTLKNQCNSGRRRGVENGAIKMKQKHQKVDTRVLNDPMHDFQLVRVDLIMSVTWKTHQVSLNLVGLC